MNSPSMNRKNFRRQAGQSMVELSVFSVTIMTFMGVLVSQALSANFNQRMAMMANRRAYAIADQIQHSELSAQIEVLYDKTFVSPASIFGIGEKRPVYASASAMRSNDLFAAMDVDGEENDIMRQVFDINGKVYSFTIAAFVTPPDIQGYTRDFKKPWDGNGACWEWFNCDISKDGSCDVDGDGQDETGVSKRYPNGTTRLFVLDNQEGEFDSSIDEPDQRNGIIPVEEETKVQSALLSHKQVEGTYSSRTEIKTAKVVTRYIRLNARRRDFSNVERQIAENNADCYGKGAPCAAHERDELIWGADGQVYLVVRSAFSEDRTAYFWTVKEGAGK